MCTLPFTAQVSRALSFPSQTQTHFTALLSLLFHHLSNAQVHIYAKRVLFSGSCLPIIMQLRPLSSSCLPLWLAWIWISQWATASLSVSRVQSTLIQSDFLLFGFSYLIDCCCAFARQSWKIKFATLCNLENGKHGGKKQTKAEKNGKQLSWNWKKECTAVFVGHWPLEWHSASLILFI